MTKYLFLTTIFAITHAGRQKKEEVSPVSSSRSSHNSSRSQSTSSESLSESEKNTIKKISQLRNTNSQLLEKFNQLTDNFIKKETQRTILTSQLDLLITIKTLTENGQKLYSDSLYIELLKKQKEFEKMNEAITMMKEIRDECIQLQKDNLQYIQQLNKTNHNDKITETLINPIENDNTQLLIKLDKLRNDISNSENKITMLETQLTNKQDLLIHVKKFHLDCLSVELQLTIKQINLVKEKLKIFNEEIVPYYQKIQQDNLALLKQLQKKNNNFNVQDHNNKNNINKFNKIDDIDFNISLLKKIIENITNEQINKAQKELENKNLSRDELLILKKQLEKQIKQGELATK